MELLGKSATQLIDLLKNKKISKKEIFDYFSRRINKYNPELNSYLTVTEEFKETDLGLPIAIKDNCLTRGVRTTASANVLDEFIPPYSATIVDRISKAGLVSLGKTNMDAWAHGSSTETSDYGPTKNPYDTSRVPGGSSGGSAAAVASYMAPIAIGTETAGSIRQPAAWCGIVGLKPTYGRVSRYGIVAMGSSLDCPGPMTQTVEDAAYLLEILAGKDEFDATSSDVKPDKYLDEIKTSKKFTIGISDEYFDGVDDEVKEKIMQAIKILESQGHTLKKVKLIHPKYSISTYTIIGRAEVSSNLARYDGIRYGNSRLNFGAEAKRRIMLGTYTLSHGYFDAYYKKAQKVRQMIAADFKQVYEDVDMIVAPTTPMTALKIGDWEKYPFFGEVMDVLNEPAAVAGLPAINIPVGLDKNNLPVGMQFIGNYFQESKLLNVSHFFEKETNFFNVREFVQKKYE